jgi:DNA-binding FrmR family transcriptional regulator
MIMGIQGRLSSGIPCGGIVVDTSDDPQGATMTARPGYSGSKDDYLKRLRRIEGQVRGLQRMVEQDDYCIDVLTQVSAVTKALQAVSLGLLEDHIGHCVVDAARESDQAGQAKVREAADAIARLVRS